MKADQLLRELLEDRAALAAQVEVMDAAISLIQRYDRGRQDAPVSVAEANDMPDEPPKIGRRKLTEKEKAAIGRRMKRYWRLKRKGKN